LSEKLLRMQFDAACNAVRRHDCSKLDLLGSNNRFLVNPQAGDEDNILTLVHELFTGRNRLV